MLIVAHRGASYLAPENTLASVNLAWEIGADAVEIDVHLSKDSRIMVSHDASTKRTGGVDLAIKDTDSAGIRKVDVGSHKGEKYAGEKVPYFEEVLDTIPAGKRLFVEIKCGTEIIPFFLDALEKSGKTSQIDAIGFGFEVMSQIKQTAPHLPVYWLKGGTKDASTGEWLPLDPSLVQLAAEANFNGLNTFYAGTTQALVNAAKSVGKRLCVWTVNDLEEARRLQGLGVDAITTDRPELLIEHLRQDM